MQRIVGQRNSMKIKAKFNFIVQRKVVTGLKSFASKLCQIKQTFEFSDMNKSGGCIEIGFTKGDNITTHGICNNAKPYDRMYLAV